MENRETPARLWQVNGKAYLLSDRADDLPEKVKIALISISDDRQRFCTASNIFLGESFESLTKRLEISIDEVKDSIVAGCQHLLTGLIFCRKEVPSEQREERFSLECRL